MPFVAASAFFFKAASCCFVLRRLTGLLSWSSTFGMAMGVGMRVEATVLGPAY